MYIFLISAENYPAFTNADFGKLDLFLYFADLNMGCVERVNKPAFTWGVMPVCYLRAFSFFSFLSKLGSSQSGSSWFSSAKKLSG